MQEQQDKCQHETLDDSEYGDRVIRTCPDCESKLIWEPVYGSKWRLVEPAHPVPWVANRAGNLDLAFAQIDDPRLGPGVLAYFKNPPAPYFHTATDVDEAGAALHLARIMGWLAHPPAAEMTAN